MPDFRITLDVKDVTGGDVDMIVEDLHRDYDDDLDASAGDFAITVHQKVGDNFFSRSPGDDDIEV